MKAAIVAWTCLVLSGGVYAENVTRGFKRDKFSLKDFAGIADTFKVFTVEDGKLTTFKWDVHLDDSELDRIREACR